MGIPNPYETQTKISAYKNDDGTFRLSGPTFGKKEKIKELGGRWDGHAWTVPLSAILVLKPLLMIRVRVEKHCHKDEQISFATHKEVQCGYMQMGCDLCDTPASCGKDVKIIEVIDKDCQELANRYE